MGAAWWLAAPGPALPITGPHDARAAPAAHRPNYRIAATGQTGGPVRLTRVVRRGRGNPLTGTASADAVDVDEKVARAAQGRILPVRRVLDQARVLHPADKLAQRDLRLGPAEGAADTVVDAAAEAEVFVVRAIRDEPVGVGEAIRVAVARSE